MSLRRPSARLALATVAGSLVIASLFPFRVALPTEVANGARRENDGLAFPSPGLARLILPAGWIEAVNAGGTVAVELDVAAARRIQHGPARIFTSAVDHLHANLTIAQEGDALVVRVRRGRSDAVGRPAFRVPHTFQAGRWHHVRVALRARELTVHVDGREVVSADVGSGRGWDVDAPATLGNEAIGHRPWLGRLRTATLTVDGTSTDLLDPGASTLPSSWVETPLRWKSLDLVSRTTPGQALLHVAGFALLGWLLVRGTDLGIRRSMVVGTVFAVLVQAAKILVVGRHPSVLDMAIDVGSVMAGIHGADRLVPRRISRGSHP